MTVFTLRFAILILFSQAVEFALSFGMWGHAFSTALLVSPMCFNAVRVEYASSLNFFGQPRKSQYWIKQADGPPPQFSGLYEPLHLDCVKTLYVLNAIPAAVHPQDILEAEQSEVDCFGSFPS